MNLERFLRDYGIHFAGTSDRHYKGGWINLPCPFCIGHAGNHLGYSIQHEYFSCFRCGGKSIFKVIQKLTGYSNQQVQDILRKYRGKGRKRANALGIQVKKSAFKMPDDIMPLRKSKLAMRYLLEERKHFSKMDIAWLAKRFGIRAIGSEGLFMYQEKQMDLSYRILAPIIFDYEIVSWQTRDISGNAKFKYITCPERVEKIHHKEILYNPPDPIDNPIIVLCEGIFDVWKCTLAGFPATCCFGVKYKVQQLKALLDYEKIIIFFDPDKAGSSNCRKLRRQLLFAGKQVEFIKNASLDPGDMRKSALNILLKPLWIVDGK